MDVAFEVVDTDERKVGAEGQGLGEGDADQQSSGEAWAFGDGDGFEIAVADTGLVHGFADDGEDGAEVFAGGQFGDDAAVVGMDELRGDDVGECVAAAADDGCRGFVAGAFDAENEAGGHYRECRG